jgi:uncharacterized membrane protein
MGITDRDCGINGQSATKDLVDEYLKIIDRIAEGTLPGPENRCWVDNRFHILLAKCLQGAEARAKANEADAAKLRVVKEVFGGHKP